MQAWYPPNFDREMGCTVGELSSWLRGASGGRPVDLGAHGADITIGPGKLRLQWQPLPARRIALLCMPRLAVTFSFEQVDEATRQRFMRYFDLYTQRGGG